MGIEDRLRQSLHARAHDVTPDPATWDLVQHRIRRGHRLRTAMAGAAALSVVALAVVTLPTLADRRVEFAPGGPAATQTPAPDATEPAAPVAGPTLQRALVFTDGIGTLAKVPAARLAQNVVDGPGDEGGAGVVTVRPGGTPANVQAVVEVGEDCPTLQWTQFDATAAQPDQQQGGGVGLPAGGCASSPVFSPDGSSLAWVAQESGQWAVQTADWTDDGPGDPDASFGLPWPAEQPVDIQDWVWTERTATTASGHLVLRTQRDGAWMVLRMPIERQADGALAVSSRLGPVAAMAGGWTPVAFASGGGDAGRDEDVTYTMEIDMAPDGIAGGRIIRRVGAEDGGVLDLPPELFDNTDPPFDVGDLWMTAVGDILLYGNSGQLMAWATDWSQPRVDRRLLEIASPEAPREDIVHADLLGPAPAPAPAPPPPTSRSTEGSVSPTEPATVVTRVEVYFGMTGADACVADQPVVREVEGTGVARAALTELLEGPTPTESNEGVVSPFTANTAGALNDITITDGQAHVDFVDFRGAVGNDSCTKSAIVDALNRTLRQFPSVTSTRYSFDGDVEAFETWLGSGSEPMPDVPEAVAETAEQVLAAAQAGDYDALNTLMPADFSCTFSDQPEDCEAHWRDLEAQGEDPLGTLAGLLTEPATRDDGDMWVWPSQWAAPGSGYLGPRTGIAADGTWRFYVAQPGG